MEWNRETILHFISLIKQRPAIWDFQSPDYKIKRKRLEAVEEIALLMGVSPKEVSTKWVILRNQYSREKRRIMAESEDGSPYTTKWYAYKDMDALMGRKRHIRSFWNQESKTEDDDSSSSPPPLPTCRPSTSGLQQAPAIDTVTQSSLTLYNQAIKTLKSIRELKNEHSNDELTTYGLYIAAHIRKFSPPLQSRAKYEINKILYALDLESMGEYSASIPSVDDDDVTITKECKFDPLQSQKEGD